MQYYLSPVKLFRTALGTYDLELADTMAERTQLDPKEYQPYLQQLRSINTEDDIDKCAIAFQHAQIDLLLQRYPRALRNLYSAGDSSASFVISEYKSMEKQKILSNCIAIAAFCSKFGFYATVFIKGTRHKHLDKNFNYVVLLRDIV